MATRKPATPKTPGAAAAIKPKAAPALVAAKTAPPAKAAAPKAALKAPVAAKTATPKAAAPAKAPVARKAAPAKTPARPAAPARPAPSVARAPAAAKAPAERTLKMKELVEMVAKASGGKKKSVKPVVEATLAALGAALGKGDDLNLPLLGKAHVNRQRDSASGEVLVIRLRRMDAKTKPAKEPLAPAGD